MLGKGFYILAQSGTSPNMFVVNAVNRFDTQAEAEEHVSNLNAFEVNSNVIIAQVTPASMVAYSASMVPVPTDGQ